MPVKTSSTIIKTLERMERAKNDLAREFNYKKIRDIRATVKSAEKRKAAEESSVSETIFDARVNAMQAASFLEIRAQRIRAMIDAKLKEIQPVKEQIAQLEEQEEKAETKELVAITGKPRAKGGEAEDLKVAITAMEKAEAEAAVKTMIAIRGMIEEILEFLDGRYIMSMTSYFVAVGGKYKAVIWAIDEIVNTPEVKKELEKNALLKHEIRIQRMKEEWLEFEVLTEDITNEVYAWIEFVKKTVLPKIRKLENYRNFAVILEDFIKKHKGKMEKMTNLMELQCQMRFFKAIEMANSLSKFILQITS